MIEETGWAGLTLTIVKHAAADIPVAAAGALVAHHAVEAVHHGYHATVHVTRRIVLTLKLRHGMPRLGRAPRKPVIHVITITLNDGPANDNKERYNYKPNKLWEWREK